MIKKLQIFIFLLPLVLSAQYELSGNFAPAKDFDFVIVYKVQADRLVYLINGKVDKDGNISLPLNEKAFPGVYQVVYELPEEENNFTFIFNGKENINFSFSREEGVRFLGGQNKIIEDYLMEMEGVQMEIEMALTENKPQKTIKNLIEKQKSIQQKAESKADPFVQKYLKAIKPFIPEKFENKEAYLIYKKSLFFDNFNFLDPDLQNTPFALQLLKEYYHEFVTKQGGNNYKEIIDDIVRQIKVADKAYQKNLLTNFWQYLYKGQRSNAANYLASSYLISLAKDQHDPGLAENLERIKNTSVGSIAPNFNLKNFDSDKTFHDLNDSDFYLLIFWSTECSHCMAQIPQIYAELKDIPQEKLQVVAVGLEVEDMVWKQKAKEFGNFINVLALDQWRDDIVKSYDVRATPTFFILDNNKQILSRPRGKENLMTIIEAIKNYQE